MGREPRWWEEHDDTIVVVTRVRDRALIGITVQLFNVALWVGSYDWIDSKF